MVASAQTSRSPKRSIWQWFWRGQELAQARQSLRETPSPRQRTHLQRAQAALELGDRALTPVDPLRAGPSLPLSLSLYREAACWALTAQLEAAPTLDLADAFAQVGPEVLLFAGAGADGLEHVRTALVAKTFRETAEDLPEQQRLDAEAARAFVQALIDRQLGPERRIGRALVQRWVRLSLAVVFLLAASIAAFQVYDHLAQGPNLAAGKPWRPSSSNATVPKAAKHEYFFHTLEDDSPWVELDLGKATRFSVVEVVNRRDCCPERAAPAVIEVSQDQSRWKEVSRREDSYSTWEAKFAPTTARYVRVRVTRRSILHLAAVAVREQ